MWRMLFAHVKAAYERLSFDTVVWVGADEMNRRKGHNYLTVFADLVAFSTSLPGNLPHRATEQLKVGRKQYSAVPMSQ